MSAYVDRPVDVDSVVWAAHRVVAMHDEPADDRPAGCRQCQPGGWCDLAHWARLVVAADGLTPPHT